MREEKYKILENLCYTELVYGRINKKLKSELSKDQIENIIYQYSHNSLLCECIF